MSLPTEIDEAFASLHRQILSREKALKKGLNALQTLVVKHYQDVHKTLRYHEREIDRMRDHLKLPPLPPEPSPRALPNPP